MSETETQDETLKTKTNSAPRNLRAELQTDLITKFANDLNKTTVLPNAAIESLVELLSSSSLTSGDVITALASEDPTESEVANE